MAIKFQYNKTSLGELGKQLKMRRAALPTIKSKESALRSEVKKAKDTARDYQRRLEALTAQYDYMVALWGEFDSTLLAVEDVKLAEQILEVCAAESRLTIACDITSPDEIILTKTIVEWRKRGLPDIAKRPTIFIIG